MRSIPRRASRSGLGSFPFARRYLGNRFFFLFLRLLRCFSSPGSLPYTIMALLSLFMHGYMESFHVGSPIQISAAHGIFAPPRGFSQLITSFFGSQCQGIRPAPFLLNLSCLPYSVTGQFSGPCFFFAVLFLNVILYVTVLHLHCLSSLLRLNCLDVIDFHISRCVCHCRHFCFAFAYMISLIFGIRFSRYVAAFRLI